MFRTLPVVIGAFMAQYWQIGGKPKIDDLKC